MAACHHRAHRPGEEWLKSIDFEGNKALSDTDLVTGLALHRAEKDGRAPDPYLVQVDADRLRGEYLRNGYFDVDVQARVERKGDATTVVYTIEEGKRSHTRVRISGLPPDVDFSDVRRKIPLADGAPFDYAKYDAAKTPALGVLKDAGYARATLDASVEGDSATRTATIDLTFTPGPKCKFGEVDIQGVDGELRDAIERRLHFSPGETYSHRAIAATQRDIYGMGRFSTVQVEPEGTGEVVGVKIAVSRSAPRALTLGGGFGIDPVSYEVRGRVGYDIAGWPWPLDKVSIDLRPAYAYLRDGSGYQPRLRALARIERLDLFTTHALGSIEGGYDYIAYEAFTEFGPKARIGWQYSITPRWKVRTGLLFEHYGFRDISPLIDPLLAAQLGLDHPEQVGAFAQSLIADYRDHPVEPRLGLYVEIPLLEGMPHLASDYTFFELVPDVRGYVPVGPVVLAARARFGAIRGDVPPTERFYAGGATSNRGFSWRRLSPSVTGIVDGDMETVPYGGAAMIDSSFEARIPITTIRKMPVGAVVFLDGGDVTNTLEELGRLSLCWSLGAGLRVNTLVGPVRADFGYRLNRKGPLDPDPGSTYAFHLSLGEAF